MFSFFSFVFKELGSYMNGKSQRLGFFYFTSKGLGRTCTLFLFSFISFTFKGPSDFTRQRLFSVPLYSLHSSIKELGDCYPHGSAFFFSFFDHRKSILCVYSHLSFSSFIGPAPFRCFTVVCTLPAQGNGQTKNVVFPK